MAKKKHQINQMSSIITARIDVQKIDKNRLYKGEKGTYLDVVLIPTPDNEYGDYMVVESVTKEERESGTKGAILGNAKVMGSRSESKPEPKQDADEPDLGW